MYLNNLQRNTESQVKINDLVFSEKYGKKSFNICVDDRIKCMEAIYEDCDFDDNNQKESVQNILARYDDIQTCFPDVLKDKALPYFIDWLIEKVHLVEIVAFKDEDAYTIFETMNDRGLSLTPTEMLKGYLLCEYLGTPYLLIFVCSGKFNEANSPWYFFGGKLGTTYQK